MFYDNEAFLVALSALSPIVMLTVGSLALLCLPEGEAGKKLARFVTLLSLLTTLLTTVTLGMFDGDGVSPAFTIGGGMLVFDPLAAYFALLIAAAATLAACIGLPYLEAEGISSPVEHQFLLLTATAGGIMMALSGEFITLFIGLEILSMAVYCMCGSLRSDRRSTEAAFKYFLLGCFSSAFFLYGTAIYYGVTGSTSIAPLQPAQAGVSAVYLAFAFIALGTGFKMGLVPFHSWLPDVYQGSPTSVTTFMSSVVKIAALAVLIRITGTIFGPALATASVVWWLLAVLSILLGNLVALRQRSVKRMLAYSSIAHAGYMILGVVAYKGESGSLASALFYLGVYALVTIGTFGTLLVLQQTPGTGITNRDDISQFNGLARTHPVLAGVMALLLLTLAGLPPGMGGLIGKLYVFSAALRGDFLGLALIAVAGSVIGLFYYLRVIIAMYFVPSTSSGADPSHESVQNGLAQVPMSARLALAVCAVGVVILGVAPTPLYERALEAVHQFGIVGAVRKVP